MRNLLILAVLVIIGLAMPAVHNGWVLAIAAVVIAVMVIRNLKTIIVALFGLHVYRKLTGKPEPQGRYTRPVDV